MYSKECFGWQGADSRIERHSMREPISPRLIIANLQIAPFLFSILAIRKFNVSKILLFKFQPTIDTQL